MQRTLLSVFTTSSMRGWSFSAIYCAVLLGLASKTANIKSVTSALPTYQISKKYCSAITTESNGRLLIEDRQSTGRAISGKLPTFYRHAFVVS